MRTTKVFQSGHSQAVRIPKEFRIIGDEVEIFRQNGDLILRPKAQNLKKAFELFAQFPDDFFSEGRVDEPPQERDF